MEKYAPAGGIAISESVKTCIDRIPEIKTILIGSPTLKGINREIKIHAIISHNLTHPHIFSSEDVNLENLCQINQKRKYLSSYCLSKILL